MAAMWTREQWRRFIDHPVVEWALFVLGVVLIIIGIITGPIPGPGGIFFAAPGLALVLKTSLWAKRRYVHFKRWQPKAGRWTDWMLRRKSARRRELMLKEGKDVAGSSATGEIAQGSVADVIPGPPLSPPEMPGDPERAADRTD